MQTLSLMNNYHGDITTKPELNEEYNTIIKYSKHQGGFWGNK